MELKKYQRRVCDEIRVYLTELARQQAAGNKHAALDAWEAVRVPGRRYAERRNALGRDMPSFCLKVPTGGGKTLLATQILGSIYGTILEKRNGVGLVLWVVPSDQIYKDTLKALRDRNHFYRFSLEHAVSRRVEVWEKHEINRLTPTQLNSALNVLLIKLASANRETKDQLKMFQDSGGNIVMHFPPEDDVAAHRALKEKFPNLKMLGDDGVIENNLVRTSLGNLLAIHEPAVILDEGHKAYSELAQKTIEGFNASIVVELSATPVKESNVLCRVSGDELLKDGMIKLPINICNSNEGKWENCLGKAKLKREELQAIADGYFDKSHRQIRPLVLIQVERTGKDQREDGTVIHSEQVKEYLIQRLGINETEIAIKSSDKDDIEGIDLLADGCRINWIITKAALQEGWDCPFAYILVSLNNTGSAQSMTQLIGRVLRQPFAARTEIKQLDESYVYCLKTKADAIAREVKKALENEGYEGEGESVVDQSGDREPKERQFSFFRKEFKSLYRPFNGKIYLPRFCVKNGSDYEGLDYFRHLISQVDVELFNYGKLKWDVADMADKAKDFHYSATLGEWKAVGEEDASFFEPDETVLAWLVASLPYEHFSFKQLRVVVEKFTTQLCAVNPSLKNGLGLVKFTLRNKCREFIETETDRLAEAAFDRMFEKGGLCFYLECVECRFEIPPSIEVRRTKPLMHSDYSQMTRSLFDYVPEADFNDYEKEVALVIDRHPEVLWWYRNKVGQNNFAIQGFRKNRIFPDFVVQNGEDEKPVARVVVVESKGKHLLGNLDTEYKRKMADYFSKAGKQVSWQKLGEGFDKHQFRFQILDEGLYDSWRDELNKLVCV